MIGQPACTKYWFLIGLLSRRNCQCRHYNAEFIPATCRWKILAVPTRFSVVLAFRRPGALEVAFIGWKYPCKLGSLETRRATLDNAQMLWFPTSNSFFFCINSACYTLPVLYVVRSGEHSWWSDGFNGSWKAIGSILMNPRLGVLQGSSWWNQVGTHTQPTTIGKLAPWGHFAYANNKQKAPKQHLHGKMQVVNTQREAFTIREGNASIVYHQIATGATLGTERPENLVWSIQI